mmetsp:Transcript_12992/g.34756  ORF Transcript_12992/g.34756 Transcript_12992/m.34756 type:complete len:324 (+) Transcript_12992:123-1094(+)
MAGCACNLLLSSFVLAQGSQLPRTTVLKPKIPGLGDCPDVAIPDWALHSLYVSSPFEKADIAEELTAVGKYCKLRPFPPNYLHPSPPNYSGPPASIPKIARTDLPADVFYERFARIGLPVVLTGLFSNLSWWGEHVKNVVSVAEQDRDWHSGMENGWCTRCGQAARLGTKASEQVLNFAAPSYAEQPNVLWAHLHAEFGGPEHFDWSCEGTVSIQYQGSKKWTLWAPWHIGHVEAHTRFEVTVNAFEAIWYPPAWFHQTRVLLGFSVSAAHFTVIPTYGVLTNQSFWQTLFETCADGGQGWRERRSTWDRMFRGESAGPEMEL